jgi:hypothetical protein
MSCLSRKRLSRFKRASIVGSADAGGGGGGDEASSSSSSSSKSESFFFRCHITKATQPVQVGSASSNALLKNTRVAKYLKGKHAEINTEFENMAAAETV